MPGTEFEKVVTYSCAGSFKLLRSPGIDSASLCSLAVRYDNLFPSHFLAPVDCYRDNDRSPRNQATNQQTFLKTIYVPPISFLRFGL
jgi:hypothetical protein